jgi:hypothetical protein
MAIQYNSNYDETIPFSDVCAQFALTANDAQSFTVPGLAGSQYSVHFGYTSTSNVFVCKNAVPVIPSANSVGTQQYNEFRPGDDGTQRYVNAGDIIYMITPDATAYIGISLRSLNA